MVPMSAIQATRGLQGTLGVSRTHRTWQDLLLMLSPGSITVSSTHSATVNAHSMSPLPSHLLSLVPRTVCNLQPMYKKGNSTSTHWGNRKEKWPFQGTDSTKHCAGRCISISSFDAHMNPLPKAQVIPTMQMIKWRAVAGQTTNPASSRDLNLRQLESQTNPCFTISRLSEYIQEPGPAAHLGG